MVEIEANFFIVMRYSIAFCNMSYGHGCSLIHTFLFVYIGPKPFRIMECKFAINNNDLWVGSRLILMFYTRHSLTPHMIKVIG